jgi:hypothetical protein
VIYPAVHLNGTSKERLERSYQDAYSAVLRAECAVGKIEFNERDYYPQGGEAWETAKRQAQEVAAHLEAVQTYLGEIIGHLDALP